MSSPQRLGVLGAAFFVFAVLATANAGGYRFGVSDQSFYGVTVLARANPSLYPHDAPLLEAQSRFMLSDDLLGWILRMTGIDLAHVYFVLYAVTLIVLFAGAITFGRRMGLSWWATTALLLLFTLRHHITKTGANTLEGYAHVRMLSFGLGVAALAALLQRQMRWSVLWIALAAIMHPTTALWFGIALATGAVTAHASRPAALALVVPVGLIAIWAVLRGPLAGHLAIMDGPWLDVLASRDYLFPASWPLTAWIINLAYPVVIMLIFRARQARGLAAAGEGMVVAGMLGLLAVFLLSLPFSAAHVALAVQLQVNRVFWLMDFVATAYLAWWLLDLVAIRGAGRTRIVAIALIGLLSAGRAIYVLNVEADRRLVQVSLPAGPWRDAMIWLKQQPDRWLVLADPVHVWKYGVSVRLAGEKDVLLDLTKDPAVASYDRATAMRVADRTAALQEFDRFTTADVRALASRYNLDVLVVDAARAFDLPTLYRNDAIAVYDLR